MINTLYGLANDHRDIARKVITKSMSRSFTKIIRNFDDRFWHNILSISFQDECGNPVSVNFPGIYAIYRKNDNIMECLYVGQTGYSIHNRVRRFYQALEGSLRDDENHSGGEWARNEGVRSTDDLYLHYMESWEIRKLDEEFYDTFGYRELDEYVAPLLKAKYNTRKAHV